MTNVCKGRPYCRQHSLPVNLRIDQNVSQEIYSIVVYLVDQHLEVNVNLLIPRIPRVTSNIVSAHEHRAAVDDGGARMRSFRCTTHWTVMLALCTYFVVHNTSPIYTVHYVWLTYQSNRTHTTRPSVDSTYCRVLWDRTRDNTLCDPQNDVLGILCLKCPTLLPTLPFT